VWRGAAAARPLYSASNAVDINILCHLISTGTVSTGIVKNGGVPNSKEGRSGVIRYPGTIVESARATRR
jgi:hypothetical protein